MNPLTSTIAAISTPRGRGGIAVVRISGADAENVAGRIFKPACGRPVSELADRFAAFGEIFDSDGEICDTGICTVFRAPKSFTGENVCEISCHGGTAVTEAVLMSALANGAVMADAGEFTRRAFIGGKLSLSEAEAVGLLIDADTAGRRKLASGAARGNVTREISRLSDALLDVMTALYAAIDYPEEDVGDEGERNIARVLSEVLSGVCRLLDTYKTGRAIQSGVKCVICGRPNVGKSSLFNKMAGEECAIVTDIAGTTRDILRETVSFGGVTLRLSDTAGLRTSDDMVEKIGVDRANSEIDGAELVISVWNRAEPMTDEDHALTSRLRGIDVPKIAVFNKCDLDCGMTADETAEIEGTADKSVYISCSADFRTADCRDAAQGLDALSDAVSEIFGSGNLDLGHDAIIWDARQRSNLLRARQALSDAVSAIELGDPIDAVCTMAEEAMAALSETDGRGVEETIVNEIFARFCVGK